MISYIISLHLVREHGIHHQLILDVFGLWCRREELNPPAAVFREVRFGRHVTQDGFEFLEEGSEFSEGHLCRFPLAGMDFVDGKINLNQAGGFRKNFLEDFAKHTGTKLVFETPECDLRGAVQFL